MRSGGVGDVQAGKNEAHADEARGGDQKHGGRATNRDDDTSERRHGHAGTLPQDRVERDCAHHLAALYQRRKDGLAGRPVDTCQKPYKRGNNENVAQGKVARVVKESQQK